MKRELVSIDKTKTVKDDWKKIPCGIRTQLKEDEDVLILSRETVRKSEGKERERTCGPTPSRYLVFETVSCCLLFSPLKKRGGWVQWTCIKN